MDTANNAHLPHTTTPSKHHSYVSPPPQKTTETSNILTNERTYRDGIPKKQPNKVGMTPQYPYGLSSLYRLPFFQPHTHTHTHTNPWHATPAISTANRMWQLQHFTMQHTSPSHCNLSSTCSNTHSRLHTCTTYPTFYTTIHTYNDTYTLPPPFTSPTVSMEHISKNITKVLLKKQLIIYTTI